MKESSIKLARANEIEHSCKSWLAFLSSGTYPRWKRGVFSGLPQGTKEFVRGKRQKGRKDGKDEGFDDAWREREQKQSERKYGDLFMFEELAWSWRAIVAGTRRGVLRISWSPRRTLPTSNNIRRPG